MPGVRGGALLGDHERTLAGLWRAADQGRLPHALLFFGPRGIGKFAAALRLARGLLCATRAAASQPPGPCGACPACRRSEAGSHLDLLVLDVAGEEGDADGREERIRIERIVRREGADYAGQTIEEFLGLRPADGGWRCVLVREAERLRHSQNEAQNALLKMLEEPGQRVLWVLETSRPAALLPTVRSRCVAVAFRPLEPDQVLLVLERAGVERERGAALARWSRGCPGEALALLARGALDFRELFEGVLCGVRSARGALTLAWEVEGQFQGKTPSAKQRDAARACLDLGIDVLGDLLRAAAGADPQRLPHGDLVGRSRLSETACRSALERFLEARADLELNLDADLVLEGAFAALASERAVGKPA